MSRGSLALAWVGGGAFVASLLYFLYFYFVDLGRPVAPGDWIRPLTVDVALFALFSVHHSLMPRARLKQWFASVAPAALERTTYVWTASILLALVCLTWRDVPGVLYHVRGVWGWLLRLIQVMGIALIIRASARLDMLDLAGIRQVQAAAHHPRQAMPLQLTGPYALVRHPIYLGWVAIVFAAPHMTANRLAFAAISAVYLVIGTAFEEQSLEHEFGENYREYKRKVRWRIVPGIY